MLGELGGALGNPRSGVSECSFKSGGYFGDWRAVRSGETGETGETGPGETGWVGGRSGETDWVGGRGSGEYGGARGERVDFLLGADILSILRCPVKAFGSTFLVSSARYPMSLTSVVEHRGRVYIYFFPLTLKGDCRRSLSAAQSSLT